MWYDNADEESRTKAAEGNAGAHAAPGMTTFSPSDPTKAFEDEGSGIGGPASAEEVANLKETLRQLDEKASQNYDRYLRALAEMENYKKRAARERAELLRYAGEDLLIEILPGVDNLERTLAHRDENTDLNKVIAGIELIQKQFIQALEKNGVTAIDKVPSPFDPSIHQALQKVEDASLPDDTVVEILQKGYIFNGKVIRPAMVKVAKHP